MNNVNEYIVYKLMDRDIQDNEAGPMRNVSRKISRLESIFYDFNPILRSFPRFSTLTAGSVFRYRVMGSFSTCV